ncbi:MAG: hypothetical protein HQ518_20355 [Rhodopirellula sp.]|nr:hypothetical protein [Rhodopirellula sp.]
MVSHNSFEDEAERCLLGSILLKPDALSKVENVETSDFGSFLHRAIFETVRELVADGVAVDAMTVEHRLRNGPFADDFRDRNQVSQFLIDCLESVPNAAHADYYAAQVIEASRRRQAIRIGDELADAARNGGNIEELIQKRLPDLTAMVNGEQRLSSRLTVRCLADVVPPKVGMALAGNVAAGKALTVLRGSGTWQEFRHLRPGSASQSRRSMAER